MFGTFSKIRMRGSKREGTGREREEKRMEKRREGGKNERRKETR